MRTPSVRAVIRAAIVAAWLVGVNLPDASAVEVSTTTRVLPSGDGIELEYRSEGETWTDIIPIYETDSQAGSVRYFSAGVGMGERQAEYPLFALKIVLTAGGKPYAAHADVHIVEVDGERTHSIPADRVKGPWLFVDLPSGTYDITGNRGPNTATLKRITVVSGQPRVVHLRFPADVEPE